METMYSDFLVKAKKLLLQLFFYSFNNRITTDKIEIKNVFNILKKRNKLKKFLNRRFLFIYVTNTKKNKILTF